MAFLITVCVNVEHTIPSKEFLYQSNRYIARGLNIRSHRRLRLLQGRHAAAPVVSVRPPLTPLMQHSGI